MKAHAGYNCRRDTPSFFAAMYLISSDEELFYFAGRCFGHGDIDFSKAILRDMSTHTYTLLMAAKDVHSGSSSFTTEVMHL